MKYLPAIACVLAISSASAQGLQATEEYKIPYDSMDQVKVELNLSEEQLAKWNAVNDKYYPELRKIESVDTLELRVKMRKVRNVYQDRDAELKEFIFAAQWEKYQMNIRNSSRNNMRARRQGMMEKKKERMKQMREKKNKSEGDN